MIGSSNQSGIIPRVCNDILLSINKLLNGNKLESSQLKAAAISASFYEIYNEKIYDLLSANVDIPCRLREPVNEPTYVESLIYRKIESIDDITDILVEGHRKRSTAPTLMNASSSRSHAIFTLHLQQEILELSTSTFVRRHSRLNMVDLAGSEKTNLTGVTGQNLVEANNINKSLSTLGDVIKALSEKQTSDKRSSTHVPFRNSILTRLLKESLSGNSKSTLIGTIRQTDVAYNESLTTLRYIERVKSISTYVTKNDSVAGANQLIIELKRQIETLTFELNSANHEKLEYYQSLINYQNLYGNLEKEVDSNSLSDLNEAMTNSELEYADTSIICSTGNNDIVSLNSNDELLEDDESIKTDEQSNKASLNNSDDNELNLRLQSLVAELENEKMKNSLKLIENETLKNLLCLKLSDIENLDNKLNELKATNMQLTNHIQSTSLHLAEILSAYSSFQQLIETVKGKYSNDNRNSFSLNFSVMPEQTSIEADFKNLEEFTQMNLEKLIAVLRELIRSDSESSNLVPYSLDDIMSSSNTESHRKSSISDVTTFDSYCEVVSETEIEANERIKKVSCSML